MGPGRRGPGHSQSPVDRSDPPRTPIANSSGSTPGRPGATTSSPERSTSRGASTARATRPTAPTPTSVGIVRLPGCRGAESVTVNHEQRRAGPSHHRRRLREALYAPAGRLHLRQNHDGPRRHSVRRPRGERGREHGWRGRRINAELNRDVLQHQRSAGVVAFDHAMDGRVRSQGSRSSIVPRRSRCHVQRSNHETRGRTSVRRSRCWGRGRSSTRSPAARARGST